MEMILKDYVLASELSRHSKYHITRYSKKPFDDKCMIWENARYIPKTFLLSSRDKTALGKCTVLDDYLPLSYVANYLLNVHVDSLYERIKFSRATNQKMFEYIQINKKLYLKIPKELQSKIKNGVSYAVTDWRRFTEYEDVKDSYTFGDFLIVFF